MRTKLLTTGAAAALAAIAVLAVTLGPPRLTGLRR